MTPTVKTWTIRFTILAILVAAVFFLKKEMDKFDSYPTGTPLNEDSLKFNAAEWKKKREYYEDIRPYMLTDLMTNVLHVGMDSTTVKDLLGETEGLPGRRWWQYRLGIYRELEASYLEIEFDSSGKVKEIDIVDR